MSKMGQKRQRQSTVCLYSCRELSVPKCDFPDRSGESPTSIVNRRPRPEGDAGMKPSYSWIVIVLDPQQLRAALNISLSTFCITPIRLSKHHNNTIRAQQANSHTRHRITHRYASQGEGESFRVVFSSYPSLELKKLHSCSQVFSWNQLQSRELRRKGKKRFPAPPPPLAILSPPFGHGGCCSGLVLAVCMINSHNLKWCNPARE